MRFPVKYLGRLPRASKSLQLQRLEQESGKRSRYRHGGDEYNNEGEDECSVGPKQCLLLELFLKLHSTYIHTYICARMRIFEYLVLLNVKQFNPIFHFQ